MGSVGQGYRLGPKRLWFGNAVRNAKTLADELVI
jgi:hypothetical protein